MVVARLGEAPGGVVGWKEPLGLEALRVVNTNDGDEAVCGGARARLLAGQWPSGQSMVRAQPNDGLGEAEAERQQLLSTVLRAGRGRWERRR